MTRQQKLVPAFLYRAAPGRGRLHPDPLPVRQHVDCEAPLFGGEPKDEAPVKGLIRPEEDCPAKGRSRLTVAAFAALSSPPRGWPWSA